MKYFFVLMILAFTVTVGYADTSSITKLPNAPAASICEPKNLIVLTTSRTTSISAKQDMMQRGCCSWHQGVCGCSKGRQVCCDGSLSPTCRC